MIYPWRGSRRRRCRACQLVEVNSVTEGETDFRAKYPVAAAPVSRTTLPCLPLRSLSNVRSHRVRIKW